MNAIVRYGVFRLAQVWSLVSEKRAEVAFCDRASALAAAEAMVTTHRASGQAVELLIQEEAGSLCMTPRPGGAVR